MRGISSILSVLYRRTGTTFIESLRFSKDRGSLPTASAVLRRDVFNCGLAGFRVDGWGCFSGSDPYLVGHFYLAVTQGLLKSSRLLDGSTYVSFRSKSVCVTDN